jgi:lactoylglutathione lyase
MSNPMVSRAFPVVYSGDVERAAEFWELLGFERFYQLPGPDGRLGYVGLRSGTSEVAVTHKDWARQRYGLEPGEGPRFEMYVYVDDLDGVVDRLQGKGVQVLREPENMPWGERIATVVDPDGNPVALCADQADS